MALPKPGAVLGTIEFDRMDFDPKRREILLFHRGEVVHVTHLPNSFREGDSISIDGFRAELDVIFRGVNIQSTVTVEPKDDPIPVPH